MTRVLLLLLAAWTVAGVGLVAVIATAGHRLRTRPSPMAPRSDDPAPDPVGVASARLFGAGVDRRQRLVALRFLGVLLARAADDGHIHCDPDDLVGLGILNGLLPAEVDRSRIWLEAVGVLERVPTGWFITNFAPVGDEVPPADVMAAIGRVLAKPVDDEEPVVAPAPAPAPAPPLTPVPPPSRSRLPTRWVAAPVGLAAAVLAVALVLSGQVPLPLPGRAVSNNGNDAQQVESAQRGTATTAPEAPSLGSVSTAVSAPSSSSQSPPIAAAPGVAPPSTVACPQGGVVAAVETMTQQVDGSVPSAVPSSAPPTTVPPVVHTVVSGTVRDTSSASAVVRPFPVDVTFTDASGVSSQTVTAKALSAPATIAAGGSLPWSVTVDNPPQNPVPAKASAGAPTWRWDDATLAAACPR